MYINKNNFNEILARWMKSDPELWSCLTKVEIKVLHQRITKEYSFEKIAEEIGGTIAIVDKIFTKVIERIAKQVDHEIAVELFLIHKKIENPHLEDIFILPSVRCVHLN